MIDLKNMTYAERIKEYSRLKKLSNIVKVKVSRRIKVLCAEHPITVDFLMSNSFREREIADELLCRLRVEHNIAIANVYSFEANWWKSRLDKLGGSL